MRAERERGFVRITHDDVETWDKVRAQALAELSRSAAPDFYSFVPLQREDVLKLIANQLGRPRTETTDLYALSRGGEDIALVSALPSPLLDRFRQEATLAIIRSLDRVGRAAYMAALGAYTSSIEAFDADSFYLTRIAVKPGARRGGTGTAAMRHFVELGAGRVLSLHVKADNAPAIALYRKFGFSFVSDKPFQFRAMLKHP